MKPDYRQVLRTLKLHRQIRFLLYLCWLKVQEKLIYSRPRARIHWVGYAGRPRRLERMLLAVLFIVAIFILEPHEYRLWAVLWGGGAALFVNFYLIYSFIPRRNRHDRNTYWLS